MIDAKWHTAIQVVGYHLRVQEEKLQGALEMTREIFTVKVLLPLTAMVLVVIFLYLRHSQVPSEQRDGGGASSITKDNELLEDEKPLSESDLIMAKQPRESERDRKMNIQENAAKETPSVENSKLVQYEKMKQDFEQDAATFRSQHPVYAEFANVFESKVMPIWYQGERARRYLLRIGKEKGDQVIADTPYDKQREKELLDSTIAEWFIKIISDMEAVVQSEEIAFTSRKEQRRWASLLGLKKRLSQNQREYDKREFDHAFSDDEIARKIFENNLREPISMVVGILQNVSTKLPPDIESRKEALEQTRQALIAEGSIKVSDKKDLKYMEPYVKHLSTVQRQYEEKIELLRDVERERERILEEGI